MLVLVRSCKRELDKICASTLFVKNMLVSTVSANFATQYGIVFLCVLLVVQCLVYCPAVNHMCYVSLDLWWTYTCVENSAIKCCHFSKIT